jgi:hypothetical protein
MSETAQTLIKAALRSIGAIATGETPTADELADGLEALRFMLRNWSSQNIRVYYSTIDTVNLSGAESYSIGVGGTINTARPTKIRGAYTADNLVEIVDEAKYLLLRVSNPAGPVAWLWYQPQYPLGYIYPWPLDSSTLYLYSNKPLTDPTLITSTISFPPEYDDAIKWNLAVRMAPEYGKEASQTILSLAMSTLHSLETLNFSNKIPEARVEVISIGGAYNIDAG